MTDKTITINAKVKASLEGMDNVVKQLNNKLKDSKIELSDTSVLSKSLKEYNSAREELDRIFSKGFINPDEVKNVDKLSKKIKNLYEEIETSVKSMKGKEVVDLKKMFPANFSTKAKNGLKEISDYLDAVSKKEIKTQGLNTLNKELSQLETQLEKINGKRIKIEVESDIELSKKKVEDLEGKKQQIRQSIVERESKEEVLKSGKTRTEHLASKTRNATNKYNKAIEQKKALEEQKSRQLTDIEKNEIEQIEKRTTATVNELEQKKAQLKEEQRKILNEIGKREGDQSKRRSSYRKDLSKEELSDRSVEIAEELRQIEKKITEEKESQRSQVEKIQGKPKEELKQAQKQAEVEVELTKSAKERAEAAEKEYQQKRKQVIERAEKTADDFVSGKTVQGGTDSEIAEIKTINEALNEQINLQKQLNEEKKEAFKSSEEKEEQKQKTQLQIDKKKLDKTRLKRDLENLKESANIDELWNKLGDTIDLSGFEKTEEGIKQLKQALRELDSEPAKKILSAFDEVEQKVEDVKEDVKKLGDGLEEINWEDNAIKSQQRDIENLQESILHFFSIGNTIEIFKRSIREAFDTIKELDAVMTETAVVTDFTVGDMWEKLPEYSEQASKLGASIKDLYSATTLYYQQGLNSDAAMNVGIETMKMARIANMEASDATQAMTAALRGFNMEINEQSATRINDVYSELAAITAADTNQIATAMTKTASIADAANMEFETTAALLAQIIETTQEAPETAGTAMKTIIARFTEVKELFSEGMVSSKDEEGEEININKIDAALKTVGISLRDFLSGAKGIDDIFLELASKWDTLDLATQRYIATTAAGSRQQSRFIAMMSNYERTMELVSAANSSAGASQKQYEKTQDSMEAKLQKLSNAWDVFVMGLANSDVVKFGVDALTKLLEIVNKLIDGFSGESGLAKAVISFMTGLGALKIGKGAINGISKFLFGQEWIKGDFKTDAFQMPFEALARSISKKEQGGLTFDLKSFLSAGGADEGVFLGLTTDLTGLTTAATGAGIAMNLLGQGVQAIGWETGGKLISDFGGALTAVGGVATMVAPLLAKLGLTAGPVGWIVAALSALMVIIPRINQAIYEATPEGRLEAAQEATQKASEAAEDAAEAYENLKGALDSIGDQQNNLNNLVEGTDAWREAVHELNKEILSLVEKYPQLSDFVTYGKNGVLGLDYNVRNKEGKTVQTILNDAEKNATAANVAKTLAQAAEGKEERELNTSKAINQFQKDYGFKVSWNSNVVGGRRTEALREMAEEIARGEAIQGAAGLSDEEFRQEANKYLYKRMAQRKDIPVQADSLTKDFYFALNEIGQELISPDQKANFSYQQAAIQAMEMANLNGKSGELVRDIDSDITTSALKAYVENAKSEFKTLTDTNRQEYATSRGWTYSGGKYYNANNQKVEEEITDEMIREFMSNTKGSKDYANYLEGLGAAFSNNSQGEILGQLLSQEGEKISYDLAKKYDGENLSSIIQDSSLDAMAAALGMTDENGKASEDFKKFINQNLKFAQKRIDKQRIENIARTAKYNKQQYSDFKHYEESSLFAEGQDFEKYTEFLNSLDNIGDNSLASAAFEQFKINSSSIEELTKFNEGINWNNPIEATKALRIEVEKGSGATQEYAKSLLEIQNSSIDASAQMKYFWNTASGEDFQKDLSEIIKTQGELTGSDVLDLAEDYSALNDMMENTGVTAEGMAQALEMVAEDNASIDQLTNSVLAYLSSIDGLDHVIHKTLKGISDFDPGLDENQVSDFMTQANETLSGNIKKGAYGNSQNKKYLDFLLGPDWDNNLSGKEYEQRLKYAADQISKNTSNMQNSWQNLVNGKDFWGNNLTKNEEGLYDELGGLGITRDSQGIKLTGYEGKTTDQIVSTLANAYGVSEQYARMMLTDFSNYSTELMQELASNDYTAGIENVKKSLAEINSIGGKTKKTIDMTEIEKIAELSGKKVEEIIQDLGLDYSDITNFYKEDGSLKDVEEVESELNRVFSNSFDSQSAEKYGGQWIESFTKSVNGKEVIDYDGMMQALSQLNLPSEAREQIAATVLSGAVQGSQEGYVKLTNQFGEPVEVPLTPNMSPEEISGVINKAYTQSEADIFAQSFVNALAGAPELQIDTEGAQGQIESFRTEVESDPIEVPIITKFEEGSNDPNNPNNSNNPNSKPPQASTKPSTTSTTTTNVSLNQSSAGSLASQIQASLDANPPSVTPILAADNTIASDITAAIESADRSVHVTATGVDAITTAINNAIPSSKNIGVSVTLEQSAIEFSGSATGIINISAYADGIKDSNLARHPALVGEEGPELIQTKDGAYLAGLNGPEMTEINRGDTVYTADETEKILKGGEHPSFPRFEKGIHGYGAVAAVKTGENSGGAQGKLEDWENPFDRLYNLVREIDEELRERERIERRYEKLLNDLNVNADEIAKINNKELKQLQKEGNLQKQLIEGRTAQITNYQNENQDLQQYAKVEKNERGESVLRIDWEAINALEVLPDTSEESKKARDEKVARIEAYVSQLEEWFDSLTGAEETLWEIEDTIQEIKERGKEEYKNFEERIKEALIASYQNQIDDMEDRFDLINETNQDLLDSIQKSIDKTRQERENQEVEEDLAEKRRRLAYLQQDTSNANQMEILRLQDEIEQGSQDYTDSLIDQKISALQEQNEKAEKQRQQQVDLAQSQLDEFIRSGGIWNKVYELMNSGLDPETKEIKPDSELELILKEADNFEGMSVIGQQQWTKDTNKQAASGMSWIQTGNQTEDNLSAGTKVTFTDKWGNSWSGTAVSDGSVLVDFGEGKNKEQYTGDASYGKWHDVYQTPEGEYVSQQEGATPLYYIQLEEAMEQGSLDLKPGDWTYFKDKWQTTRLGCVQDNGDIIAQVNENPDNGFGRWTEVGYSPKEKGLSTSEEGVTWFSRKAIIDLREQKKIHYSNYDPSKVKRFKTGGLADFTGPAWLDGTKSRPEIVLNQQDSQNFMQLRDILSAVLNRGNISNTTTENSRDITYDIDINVEKVEDDYSVEQIANKVKSLITQNARYRNDNVVSLRR